MTCCAAAWGTRGSAERQRLPRDRRCENTGRMSGANQRKEPPPSAPPSRRRPRGRRHTTAHVKADDEDQAEDDRQPADRAKREQAERRRSPLDAEHVKGNEREPDCERVQQHQPQGACSCGPVETSRDDRAGVAASEHDAATAPVDREEEEEDRAGETLTLFLRVGSRRRTA